ncbi:hypothetical protein QF000_006337 [Paraburkholderia atlantica]
MPCGVRLFLWLLCEAASSRLHGARTNGAPLIVQINVTVEKMRMTKNLLVLAALAVMLAGCVVVLARPLYVHAPRVVVY